MRIKLDRIRFLKSLGRVQRIVERRNAHFILANVLLQAASNRLELRATDLDLELNEKLDADVVEEGMAAVPAHLLYDIVKKLPEGCEVELCVDTSQKTLSLRGGRARFHLPCLDGKDFPDSGSENIVNTFTISASEFKRLLDATHFAASTEETRYYLNGIYFHTIDEDGMKLRSVATDGHRLARAQFSAPSGVEIPGIIIPRKAVLELQKLLGEEQEAEVKVLLSDAKICFTMHNIFFASKLIDGVFPDYQKVIPISNNKTVVINRKDFAQAVDRVATVSSQRGNAVKLAIDNNSLELSVQNNESGSAEESVECVYNAEKLDIGFNSQYLLDIVEHLDTEEVEILLSDANSQTVFQAKGNNTILYVLMPMRV